MSMSGTYNYPPPPPPGPGYGYGAQAPPRGDRPPAVENAVRLMFVIATISLITTIVTFATKSDLKKRLEKANPDVSSSRLDSLLNDAIAVGVVFALVFLVLYVLLAFQVRKGKNWARIVTWVFAGLGVLGALSSLASTETPISRVLSLITGIIDVVIIVLLAQGPSNRYFRPDPTDPAPC